MSKPIRISKRVINFLQDEPNYGETLGYSTLTLSQMVSDSLYSREPDADEFEEFIGQFDIQERALADQLLVNACGWSPESIIELSRNEHDSNLSEFLQQELENDDDIFEQTVEALENYNGDAPDIERQRMVANEVFGFMFDMTAEEMLDSVKSSITSAYNRQQSYERSPSF